MFAYTLDQQEVREVEGLVSEVIARGHGPSDTRFYQDVALLAQELPRSLRTFMMEMKYGERAGAWTISGFPVDDHSIGRTPSHWGGQPDRASTLREETAFLLFGSLLGDPFGWATQQNGAIVHDLLPIRGHEHEQLGSGSADLLEWHTEESFHPLRCDYLGLMCMRNPDSVPTTFASVDMIDLDDEVRKILFEPRYIILPDNSHFASYNNAGEEAIKKNQLLTNAYQRINKMNEEPEKVPLLYNDPQSPYMVVDPFYMRVPEEDQEAKYALDKLCHAVNEQLQDIVLGPGECCFIDNYRSVHGRKAFTARYDGTDRWLKRINITRDLRKSRSARLDSTSRVIF